jgi:hypothetical protein
MPKPSHGAHACVRYYVLLQWDPDFPLTENISNNRLARPVGDNTPPLPSHGRWTVEYGSYTRKDVKDEREYYREHDTPLKRLRIKEICSCEVSYDDMLKLAQEEPRP